MTPALIEIRNLTKVFPLGVSMFGARAKGEIRAVTLPSRKKDAPGEKMETDEHPRRDSTIESLSKLKPLFEGGVVTAGNASGVNDGAAALVIASDEKALLHSRAPARSCAA